MIHLIDLLGAKVAQRNYALGWTWNAAVAAFGVRVPFILCYHGVGAPLSGRDPFGLYVSRRQFSDHLGVIADAGYTMVTVSELWRRMVGGEPVHGLGAITFDDGLARTVDEAMPTLAEHGMPSTAYIPTGLLGADHPHLPGDRILTADELVSLSRMPEVEIGTHTVDHLRLPDVPADEAFRQLDVSRRELEALLERPVTSTAYPFGAHDAETRRAAAAAGYTTACGCSGAGPWAPLSLPREPIFPSVTTRRLRLKLAGLYGPVHRLAVLRNRLPVF